MTHRRVLGSIGAAALALVALAACGGSPSQGRRPNAAGAMAAQGTGPRADAQVAFMKMLEQVAAPCTPDAAAAREPEDPAAGEHPPARPGGPLPVGPNPPTGLPSLPAEAGRPRLNALEACAGRAHGNRITRALTGLQAPSARRVTRELEKLGYPGSRTHGLTADGHAVRVHLDLRAMGGRLALKVTAAGKATTVEAYPYPAQGPFVPQG